MTELKITQADRDAAADFMNRLGWLCEEEWSLMHHLDQEAVCKAFARHRADSQAELVAAAEAIERYLRETPHHNATQAAALRAALARVRGEG